MFRVSGAQAQNACRLLAGRLPPARQAALVRLTDPRSGDVIDQAVVLSFPAPHSYTGENVVEFQTHGGRAIRKAMLECLGAIEGLRHALPGEFTRRALLNGRLDLMQVEGLSDLLAAETALQRKRALSLMDGKLSRLVDRWRQGIVKALAHLEIAIDFADEDLPSDLLSGLASAISVMCAEMQAEVDGVAVAERLRDGFEVALVGAPNVGKSTLLNTLAGRQAALTSEIAGTTRDVVEVRMDLGGIPVTMLDLAGLRETDDPLERMGIDLAMARGAAADLRIFLVEPPETDVQLPMRQAGDLVLLAKADRLVGVEGPAVSGLTGIGIDDALAAISAALKPRVQLAGATVNHRQQAAVANALVCLQSGRSHLASRCMEPEIVADDFRAALVALDCLEGRLDVEAVLDVAFKSFCLGK